MKINGESGEVSEATVDYWKERLPSCFKDIEVHENIWNLDEMACFWCALPDHGFGQKGTQCKGGKKLNTE